MDLGSRAVNIDDVPTTCRSTEPHDDNIADLVSHYFGCIEICQRKHFFNLGNDIWKSKMKRVEEELRNNPPRGFHGDFSGEAKNRIEQEMGKTAVNIEAQYTRTEIVVRAISREQAEATKNGKLNLVRIVNDSRKAWLASPGCRAGIQKVRAWRRAHNKTTGDGETTPETSIPPERREVRRKKKEYESRLNSMANGPSGAETSSPVESPSIPDYCVERDVNAHIIQYRTPSRSSVSEPSALDADEHSSSRNTRIPVHAVPNLEPVQEDGRFKGSFPDHRIAISSLFQSDKASTGSILSTTRDSDRVQVCHIHLPSNNMQVSLS